MHYFRDKTIHSPNTRTKRQISGAPDFGRRGECRTFVLVSLPFLGQFQKFKDLVGEDIKTILMNLGTSQTNRQKTCRLWPQTLIENRFVMRPRGDYPCSQRLWAWRLSCPSGWVVTWFVRIVLTCSPNRSLNFWQRNDRDTDTNTRHARMLGGLPRESRVRSPFQSTFFAFL